MLNSCCGCIVYGDFYGLFKLIEFDITLRNVLISVCLNIEVVRPLFDAINFRGVYEWKM